MERKIILNLAISLDGYISDNARGFDWIKGDGDKSNDTKNQFDFTKFLESVDVVVMGRKAYEDMPEESLGMYDSKKVYVATSKKLKSKLKNVEFVEKDILDLVLELKKKEGKDIWLYGGAVLTDAFIKADVVDEYVVGIIPIILGEGRKLFLENNPKIELHLEECSSSEGIIILKYTKRK